MIKINGTLIENFDINVFTEIIPLFTYDSMMYISLLIDQNNENKNENTKLAVWVDVNNEQRIARWIMLSNKENIQKYINSTQSLLNIIEAEKEIIIFETNDSGLIKNSAIIVKQDDFPEEYKPSPDSFLKYISDYRGQI